MTPTHDGGLQAERTALSWRRTSASLMLMPLVVLRLVTVGGPWSPYLPAICVGVAACGAALCIHDRISTRDWSAPLAAARSPRGHSVEARVALMSLGALATVGAAAILVIVETRT